MAFSGGFLTLRLLPGRPILLALDANLESCRQGRAFSPKTKRLIPSLIRHLGKVTFKGEYYETTVVLALQPWDLGLGKAGDSVEL